ncbi:MAG: RluA family pseudouridine synthase [Clostridia bacterium]|nr:RluA family pseudouridine synthase [Clostridia bacterium]
MRQLIIGSNDCGQRIDKFMGKRFKTMPTALIYKFIRKKCVSVNKKKVAENYILKEGDVLSFFISDEFFGDSPKDQPFRKLKPDLSVAYEDENILIIDKPAGLIVHSDDKESYNTLINHILAYLFQKGEYDPDSENCFAPALCNRIDRNTQGLVIAAKSAKALAEMNEIIKQRLVEKKYLTAVHGFFDQKQGEIRSRLEKDQKTNTVRISDKFGKEAVTRYKVLRSNREKQLSLLEVELLTGRTHQIRAQFASLGHPLLGDGKYAVNKADRSMGFSYQALCSYSLRFFPGKEFELLSYLNGVTVFAKEPSFLSLFKS